MRLVLLLLILIGGVVALPFILLARRRNTSQGTSPAEIVTYLILAVATLVTTNSISALLEIVMPGDGVLIGGADDLALSLSTLIVAGVVAVALWIAMERTTTDLARPARELYLAVVNAVSMTVVAVGIIRLLTWALGVTSFQLSALADIAAFGGAWFLHERFRRPPEELDELRQLAGALLGLALASAGTAGVLFASFYTVLSSGQVIAGDDGLSEVLRTSLALLVVGVPFFWWFWLRGLADRPGSWRTGYALLVSITAWLSAFTALAVLLNRIMQWALDGGGGGSSSISASAAITIVAGLIYWHHRPVLGRERNQSIRIVEYVLSAIGLIAGSGAIVTLASILGDNLFGSGSIIADESRLALGALIVLILSAVTVWRYWLKALRLASDPIEANSAPRRATILILRVGYFLVGAGSLIVVLYVLLRAALDGSASDLSEGLTVAVPLVVVSGLMVWHLAELRTKPATGGAAPSGPIAGPRKLGTVTVVAADPGPLPMMIHGMRFLKRGDGVGVVDQSRADEIVAALAAISTSAAMVTVDTDGFRVIPLS
ncbi:MAG TPA: DUF5671 domain-containing protein [Acidimicrobiia bacterium]|nr:DUF5671 domain-containing protein [Acidimicrobiia bacterium]